MRSPKYMKVIQIDITNSCILACSNCTRMCGHHEKTFMMDFETFKRAVDSLDGYQGTIGVIGGEPTLHPEFERFALYLQSKYPHLYGEDVDTNLLHPTTDYMKTIQDLGLKYTINNKSEYGNNEMVPSPGLFSAVGSTYLKHFEVIQDTFKRQGLNDHSNDMYHQPALVARKDLGISDEDWIPMRDNCWLQNNWSAGITPKGAFFCEIAGTLDMLFDGPGGWPLEKDWWKREPEEFGDQLNWCETCGFACETYTRNAKDKVDDISPSVYEKLKTRNSPKMRAGHINVMEIENGVISEKSKAVDFTYQSADLSTGAPYIKYISEKFNSERSALRPGKFVSIVHYTSDITEENMKKNLDFAEKNYSKLFVICDTKEQYTKCQTLCEGVGSLEIHTYNLEKDSYGNIINKILVQGNIKEYFVASSGNWSLTKEFLEKFDQSTPNPGSILRCAGDKPPVSAWIETQGGSGFLTIFNCAASSLKKMGFDRRAQINKIQDFIPLWEKRKVISLDENLFVGSLKDVIQEGDRCVIFGNGGRAEDIFFLIQQQKGECVGIVDTNPEKQGLDFEGLIVEKPETLKERIDEIDLCLLGAPIYFEEIKEKLLSMGFSTEKIKAI